jgi:hypothetical protein
VRKKSLMHAETLGPSDSAPDHVTGGTRRFNLIDGTVLVATTALGFLWSRAYVNYLLIQLRWLFLASQGVTLRGRSAEEILRDPDSSWTLSLGTPIADMPGEITLSYALFARPGPELARNLIEVLSLLATPLLSGGRSVSVCCGYVARALL